MLDSCRDVIYRLNVQTGRFEYISPSAEAVLGFTPAELMELDSAAALAMMHPDDLLAYSRVGQDQTTTDVDCADAVAAALANPQAALAESGARVTRAALPTVRANPTEMAQLFQNLIGNAVKFRQPGVTPEIHIGAERGSGADGASLGTGVPPLGAGAPSMAAGAAALGPSLTPNDAAPPPMTRRRRQ